MKYNQYIILKNGQEALLRNGTGEDAKAVYDNFNLTHAQTDFLTSYPDENSFDVEGEKQFLIAKELSADEIEICAVVGNKIVGTAGIETIGHKNKVKHRAEFGISIERNYWGLGIGRQLANACIECAKQAGYTQLEIMVVLENINAIKLYKSLGFIEFGRNPRGFYTREHIYQTTILMRLEL